MTSMPLVALLATTLTTPQGKDPTQSAALARDLLRELVEIDTTPSQGCTRAAEAMAHRLRSAGFAGSDVQLLGGAPERRNLVARLRGGGAGKPVLFIAHLDVVDAPREGWSSGLDPFRLTERDGFFYGRGVVDVKHAVAGLVATLVRLRREGYVPTRDILVALTADEETGPSNGVRWLLRERPDLMDVAYCLNLDAGGGQIEGGKPVRMTIQTSEKVYLSLRLETTSPGGHSSLPTGENAIDRLAAGLVRLSKLGFPFRFNETTRTYFARRSAFAQGAIAADLRATAQEPPDLEAARRVAARAPLDNAILHTTCVPTRLTGGHADNALPQSARATVNCRLFPGDTTEFVRDQIAQALADLQIAVTPLGAGQPSPVTPLLPEVVGVVERLSRERWPGVPVLPCMDPWSSDSAPLRRAGIATFGVSGTFGELDLGNAHGADERLPVRSFDDGVEFLYSLIRALTAAPVVRQ